MTSPIAPAALTPAPTAPDRASRATFSARGTAWAAYQKDHLVPEITDSLANVYNNAVSANESAVSAVGAAAAAALSAGLASVSANITAWVGATNYATGATVYSPTTYQAYRRKSPGGVNATDPAADTARTYWEPITVGGLYLVVVTSTAATAVAGQLLAITNVAATTVTSPAAALVGDRWGVVVCNGLLTNVVNWNSLKHLGLSDATTALDDVYARIEPTYISAGYGWSFKP